MERDGLGGFELVVLVVGGAVTALAVAVWSGAVLALVATGRAGSLPIEDAVAAIGRLPGHAGDPAGAWPAPAREQLPGPIVYWACTTVAIAATGMLVVAIVRVVAGSSVGTARRRPLGVDGRARYAQRRELATVLVRGPSTGRFVIARFGRWLVATESAAHSSGRRWGRRLVRRGDRGAVALVGPQRSGKTVAAIAGILEWDGPAVLSSVKADLVGPTAGWRSSLGEVVAYDPTGTLGRTSLGRAAWSPVRQASTVVGAQRAARALCEAAPRGSVEGGLDFWLAQAEILLSGLLYVAHHSGRHMGAVCDWVLSQDRPGDLGQGEVRTFLDLLLAAEDDKVAVGASEASKGLVAIWEMEDRTRSSVYATAQTVVWPWSEPDVVVSSTGQSLDLDWVLGGKNTVYLCAPIEDQKRLAPAFGGLLNDLIAQVYRRVAETGQPLDPPLLIVIDEAGNTPLRSLPEYASTLSSLGIVLVTIWQSLAQIESAHGRDADTILTNHLTKLFYAGISDPATFRYVGQVLGDTEVETRSRTAGERLGSSTTQLATTSVALAPPHALRQMRPGDALLLHGTLPPAHVRTRAYYKDRTLTARAAHPLEMATSRPAAGRVDDNSGHTPH
jgi:type IV secretion system protein VirD4